MSKLAHSNQETMDAIEMNAMKNDDIEHCQCEYCIGGNIHDSDCAVHNEPAYPNGPCNCSLSKKFIPQEMVDRFLSWPLPIGFSPDCGISFDGRGKDARGYEKQWPVGTNLLSAEQARNMLEHVVAPTLRYERLLLSNAEKEIANLSAPHSATQPVPVEPDLGWLYTHCKAIGMDCKSDSGKMAEDIALFTINLQSALQRAQEAKQAAVDLWSNTGETLQKADDTLRKISSVIGQGGMWDTENLDYYEVYARISDGINAHLNIQRERAEKAEAKLAAIRSQPAPVEPDTVCWFKHGPYSDSEPLICVFDDPQDDDNYSPLIYRGHYDSLRSALQRAQEEADNQFKYAGRLLDELHKAEQANRRMVELMKEPSEAMWSAVWVSIKVPPLQRARSVLSVHDLRLLWAAFHQAMSAELLKEAGE